MRSRIYYTMGGSDKWPIAAIHINLFPYRGRDIPRIRVKRVANIRRTAWCPAEVRIPLGGYVCAKMALRFALAMAVAVRLIALLDNAKNPAKVTKKAIRKCIRDTEFDVEFDLTPNSSVGR